MSHVIRLLVSDITSRLFLGVAWCVVVLVRPGHNQVPLQPVQTSPTFQVAIDVVRLDVGVLDRNRRPVRGLTEADFTVFENGVQQPVVVFQPVDIPDSRIEETTWGREVTPDVATNDPPRGRLWVLVLDDATSRPDSWALEAAKQIARGIVAKIDPVDRMAVVFTRDNRHAQDFTNVHQRLLKAIDSFTLGFMGMGRGNIADAYFQSSGVTTLRHAAEYLAAVPDQRRALIYIGFGIGVDFFQPPQSVGPYGGGAGLDSERMRLDETKRFIRQAQLAGVSVYTFNACGLGSRNCSNGSEFLYVVSSNTGGHAVVGTNDFRSGIERAFQENSSYYLIGYRSTSAKKTGYRRVEVKVSRPGVEVRTRTGYYADIASPSEGGTLPVSPATSAVSAMLPRSELRLRATAAPFARAGSNDASVAIALGARLKDLPSSLGNVETVTVDARAFTPEGTARGSFPATVRIILKPDAAGEARFEILSRMDLKPGRYSLRLGAHAQAANIAGGVYVDVDVPNFAKMPLSLSGIILNAEPSLVTTVGGHAIAGLLPVAPTSERTFRVNQRLVTFFTLYQGGTAPLEPVTLNICILDARGRTIVEERRQLAVGRFDKLRSVEVLWAVPLERLPAGPYLLTFETTRGSVTAKRDVPFRVQ